MTKTKMALSLWKSKCVKLLPLLNNMNHQKEQMGKEWYLTIVLL